MATEQTQSWESGIRTDKRGGRTSTEVSRGWQRVGGKSNQNALEIVLILSKTSLLNKTIKSLSLNGLSLSYSVRHWVQQNS